MVENENVSQWKKYREEVVVEEEEEGPSKNLKLKTESSTRHK